MRKDLILKIIVFLTLLVALGVNVYKRTEIKPASMHVEISEDEISFNTKDIAPEIKGYGSHIEMQVTLTKECAIKDIKVLNHNETPEYASKIASPAFLNQFMGKSGRDKFIVGEDIDGITRATISSRAVSETLKACLEKIGLQKGEPRKMRPWNFNTDFYITIFIVAFLILASYLKNNFLRYLGLLFSILYFGFWKANFISMTGLGNIFLRNLPDVKSNIAWYVFIFSGIFFTILFSGFYCSYMCPFGGLQIFLKKLLKINVEISPAVSDSLRKIKYFLLWIFLVLLLVLDKANIVNYEPFSTVFLRSGTALAWLAAIIVLILSVFHYRPFCNYFCATGAFFEILSKFGRKIFNK